MKRFKRLIFQAVAALTLSTAICSCSGNGVADGMRAHYHEGMEAYRSGQYEEAVREALVTLESAQAHDSVIWQARAHELMADTYRAVYNLKAARRHRADAVSDYMAAGRMDNAFYAYTDMAGEYSNERNDSAYIMMESARRLMRPSDREQRDQFNFIYADICRVMGNYPEALERLRDIRPSWLAEVLTSADSVHIGEIYYRNAMPDSSESFFSTPAAHDDIQYWECMADMYERQGDYRSANVCQRNMINLEYDKGDTSLSNTLEFEERSFYRDRAEEARASHDRLLRYVVAVSSILAVAVLAFLAWRWRRRSRKLKTENEIMDVALMTRQAMELTASAGSGQPADSAGPTAEPAATQTADSRTAEHTDTDGIAARDDNWIYVILDFYMSRLNEISKEYFKAADEQAQKAIETEFHRELKSLRGGDIFNEIEDRINDRNENIVKRIRRIFPKFNDQYIRLMMCHLAGLSSQSACLLLSIEKGNYYVIWSRIRARIRALDHPDREELVSLFCRKQ